jgi:tungstate transport system ATP-binding protein
MLYKADVLTKVFKGHTVLNLEHLEIERHKIYALIGANGAGKTTLLNLLAFLARPTSGCLQFCGQDVIYRRQHLLDLRRRVVLVDQYPILFTGPVWKNVEFGLKVRGVSKKLRERRVEEVLELVGMQEFRLADAHKLSGGESKRVALARALVIDPEVLLCDEPTANVDEENQEIILGILERINAENRTSIIMATHYLAQSRRLAHHILMLEYGMLSEKSSMLSHSPSTEDMC